LTALWKGDLLTKLEVLDGQLCLVKVIDRALLGCREGESAGAHLHVALLLRLCFGLRVVELLQKLLILLNRNLLFLGFLCLLELLVEQLRGWNSRLLDQDSWLEPSICNLQLTSNLLPNKVKLVNRLAELHSHSMVVLLSELPRLILTEVVTKERVFEGEGVCDLELLPCNNSSSSNLVRLHLEATVFVIEQMCLLCEDAGQDPDDGPAEEPAVCSCVAAVEEGVLLFGVAVDVAVNPNLASFYLCKLLQHELGEVYLGLEVRVWVNPLPVQVNSTHCISIVSADDTIGVQAWNQDKGVKSA